MSTNPIQRSANPSSSSPTAALKRLRSIPNVLSTPSKRLRSSATMASKLPPLPTLQGEVMLEIFMHRSLSSGVLNEDFGDSERLAAVGKRVLAMVVAKILFDQRPMLSAEELESEIENKTSDDTIDEWVTRYQLRDKIRCPSALRETLKEPGETRLIFHTYVGAAYLQHSLSEITAWIGPLVNPEFGLSSPTPASVPDEPALRATSPQRLPPPRSPAGFNNSQPTGFYNPPPGFHGSPPAGLYTPPPPAATPPPIPPSQPGAMLPVFNQRCAQSRIAVEWNPISTGPSHAPSWSVECVVNHNVIARGVGKSKQQAKEDAARQAMHAMGWVVSGFP